MNSKHVWWALVSFACLWWATPPARAHGELHDLIVEATKAIEKEPQNPKLYLLRAELHRKHLGWDSALADIERAAQLTNQWPQLNLDRAGLYLDAQWYESAVVAASRYLEYSPTNAQALLIRSRSRVKLGQNAEAAEDYTRTIGNTGDPGPELFVERASALVAASNLNAALKGLDEGLKQLGPIVTLQLAALDIEVKQQRVDAALARLDAIMAQAPRKETWLVRRGEILRHAGRGPEALAAYQAALKELDSLPPVRRRVPAMAELERKIRTALGAPNP